MFITSDQQTTEALGCADASFKTPNLDRLAAQAARFTGHMCTSAQCTPSRASWMTGRFPHQVGVNVIGHMLDPQEESIAKAFNRHGYETVYFGKWHLGLSAADHAFQVTDYRTDLIDLWGAHTDYPQYHSHADARSTAMAAAYLDDYDSAKPFFMHVSWNMPHPNTPKGSGMGPFEPIEPYMDDFPEAAMPVPPSFYADDLSTKPPHQRRRAESAESVLTEDVIRRDAQRYRTLVSLMDRNLGIVLDKLEERGLAEQTVIVFSSDHGDMQGAHRLRLKGVLPYKELYNVPLLIRVPGIDPARKVVDDLTSGSSVAGTLLDAAGLPIPPSFEGRSLLPLLHSTDPPPGESVFFEHYEAYWGEHPFRGIQTKRWKYVYYYIENDEEMYDLLNDPDECVNVAGEARVAAVREQLKREVDNWWEATGALSRTPLQDEASDWAPRSRSQLREKG
ncbi:sulfatase [Paenibacillus hodogayensis]